MATDTALQRLEAALTSLEGARYELTLFVNGASASSARAIRDAHELCETHLAGRYDLSVVDVNHDPGQAVDRRILATPTLTKDFPAPERMLVGDLSDSDRVLIAFDLRGADGAGG